MLQLQSIVLFFILFKVVISQPCPNDCSSRGRCLTPDTVCECFNGFEGPDCSLMSCPKGHAWVDIANGNDNAHNLAICSNQGICSQLTGTCTCNNGFEGAACQRMSCPSNCNSVGVCLSMNSFARTKDPGYGTVYVYNNIWDANMTHGCICDKGESHLSIRCIILCINYFYCLLGFSGPDCSLRDCPTGDDPFTGIWINVD